MKKFLAIILVIILVGAGLQVFKYEKVAAEEDVVAVIKNLFNERVKLLSSKDLDEFDNNVNNSRLFFLNKSILDWSINELREIYGMAEGYGKFEIVSIVPLIRVYRTDIKGNLAVSYVQQFVLYRVKAKNQTEINIPKELIVPNENGIWRAATSDYYTILSRKDLDQWTIVEITRGDYKNEAMLEEESSPIFAESPIKYFPRAPKEGIPLPYEIENEINNFSAKVTPQSYPGWMYREQAASYADHWWNSRNTPKYPSYDADCANFVSQCLYDDVGGRFARDSYNNGVTEQLEPGVSQEWHIDPYPNYNPSYSWTWCPCQEYYALHNYDWLQRGFKGYMTVYRNLAVGDIVYLDRNYNQIPDHVGIVAVIATDGTPLVDAHAENRWHMSWEYEESLYECIHLNYEQGYHY
jgi:hypothetical protein